VGGGRRYTYAALREQVRAFARGLHALGIRKGDLVAILMGNKPQWIIADLAICSLGAIMVAVNTWVTSRELGYVLAHSDTGMLIASDHSPFRQAPLSRLYLLSPATFDGLGDISVGLRSPAFPSCLPVSLRAWTGIRALAPPAQL
jgi:non-ribosomal peptide synthetase component E (peptide arylation enzyme)